MGGYDSWEKFKGIYRTSVDCRRLVFWKDPNEQIYRLQFYTGSKRWEINKEQYDDGEATHGYVLVEHADNDAECELSAAWKSFPEDIPELKPRITVLFCN